MVEVCREDGLSPNSSMASKVQDAQVPDAKWLRICISLAQSLLFVLSHLQRLVLIQDSVHCII